MVELISPIALSPQPEGDNVTFRRIQGPTVHLWLWIKDNDGGWEQGDTGAGALGEERGPDPSSIPAREKTVLT